MDIGYIKLYRKVTSSFVWTNSNMLKLWILCLTKASHKGSRFIFNGQEIVVSSGQFVTGRAVIEKEFNEGVTRDQQIVGRTLWRWLKKFESEQMLSIKSTTKYSVITINKWDEYQSSDQQLSNGRPSSVQQLSTYKNEKNEKNEINNNNNNRVQDNEEVYPAELIQQLYHQFPTGLLQGALSDWLQEWPREMINFAIQISYDYGKELGSLKPYINAILKRWKDSGILTLEQAIAANEKFKNHQTAKSNDFKKKTVRRETLPSWFDKPKDADADEEKEIQLNSDIEARFQKYLDQKAEREKAEKEKEGE